MVGIDIQSLFADIIQSPGQRRQSLTAQGERDAVTATRGLTGRSQIFAPLVGALASSQGMRDEMLQRSVGGLFGLDTRNESEKLQQVMQGADTKTPEGQAAMLQGLRDIGMADKAVQLEQMFAAQAQAAEAAAFTQGIQSRQVTATEDNVALNREQQAAVLATAQAEQARLRAEKQANLASSLDLINGAKGLKAEDAATITSMVQRSGGAIPIPQVQAAIKGFGGFPDEGSAPAALQVRTGRLQGERGLQTFIFNPDNGNITRTVENSDGTTTDERIPSSKVAFVTATAESVTPPLTDQDTAASTTPARRGLYELAGSAIGGGNMVTGWYNESPLADVFGTDAEVAEAQAAFNGFENKILELYNRRSRPSNWSEQRLLKLLPKAGSLRESQGSAYAKLYNLERNLEDQLEFERREFYNNSANPTKQAEHRDTILDLQRLLSDFGDLPSNPAGGEVPPVMFTREEVMALPDGTQFWYDGKLMTKGI